MNNSISQLLIKAVTGLLVLVGIITFLPVIIGLGFAFGILFGWLGRAIR